MPNRFIKESICSSAQIDALTWFEQAVFIRLIVRADDFGRLDGRRRFLNNTLFITAENVSDQDVENAVIKLEEVGLAKRYEVDGKPFLYLTGWLKHQQRRSDISKYPDPPGFEKREPSKGSKQKISSDNKKISPDNVCNQLITDDNGCYQALSDDNKGNQVITNVPVFVSVNEIDNVSADGNEDEHGRGSGGNRDDEDERAAARENGTENGERATGTENEERGTGSENGDDSAGYAASGLRKRKPRKGTASKAGKDKASSMKASSKRAYGAFGHVMLEDVELVALKRDYPGNWTSMIRALDTHIASSGAAYRSHYATMVKWAERDGPIKTKGVETLSKDGYERVMEADIELYSAAIEAEARVG